VPVPVPGRGGKLVHREASVLHGGAAMVRAQLDERQWSKVAVILEGQRGAGRRGKDDRSFIEAVLWWRRTGVPWRDLPECFGPWKTVFNRFDRWSKRGKWDQLFCALQTDVDDEWHSLDSTTNRAHQHAGGAKGGRKPTPSVAHAVVSRARCTWWSMRWDCRSPFR